MSRSSLDAVVRAHRNSKPGDGLLAQALAARLEVLAPALGVDVAVLVALDVEQAEGRAQLAALLLRAKSRFDAQRATNAEHRRVASAESLIASARWVGDALELSPTDVFVVAVAATSRVLRFEASDFVVHVDRSLLVRARPILARLPEPTASLDAEALHLRWREGRGGLHLRCSPPAPRDEPAFTVRFEPPRVARAPVPLAEVLQDLGLTA